jgi:hypothetical protein
MTRHMLKTKKIMQVSDNPAYSLFKMMEFRRPAQTQTLYDFIDDYIMPLGGTIDKAGNVIIRVGDSRVLWSSHTDTIHRTGGRQRIAVNGDMIKIGHGETSNCLGADCTTGVWIMREMILHGVSGLYVFHDSEEIGGLGSSSLRKHHDGLLDGIDFAIAFDRKGYDSIITHQWGGRCCSDDFAKSLSKLMPNAYQLDNGGTFTDTANYTDVIAECTNISVGYFNQHTTSETQSISHALALRDAMLKFDETKLVKSRNAGEIDLDDYGYGWGKSYNYGQGKRSYGYDSFYDLADFIADNSDAVADMLEQYGITIDDIKDHIGNYYKG